MGLFSKPTDEEVAARKAAMAAADDDAGRTRAPDVAAAAAERVTVWRELGAPADMVIDRLKTGNTEDAYAAFAEYAGALGLPPEDVYTVHLEYSDNYENNVARGIGIIYRDRPDYSARRDAYWDAHPQRVPSEFVAGVPDPYGNAHFEAGAVRKQIGDL